MCSTSLGKHVETGKLTLTSALKYNSKKFIEMLIQQGCDVDVLTLADYEKLVEKNWFDVCVRLICRSKYGSSLTWCVKQVIKTGKF